MWSLRHKNEAGGLHLLLSTAASRHSVQQRQKMSSVCANCKLTFSTHLYIQDKRRQRAVWKPLGGFPFCLSRLIVIHLKSLMKVIRSVFIVITCITVQSSFCDLGSAIHPVNWRCSVDDMITHTRYTPDSWHQLRFAGKHPKSLLRPMKKMKPIFALLIGNSISPLTACLRTVIKI